ncbi:phosphoenolpyruvate carboxykinase (GTP) [Aestuariimicrobium sp. T2.26MG-19.2B]|uniref:phosphoenolpyruvate carboxykinase (GTP) n=1 Tax=Aestuariimicrobium sp. T2.26MG-19.2B TaxID=3040679 RepID=UPI0024778739|nr:Phosphoenolpyruvate carboxykinase [GTP] [Aestuariimicrobium sp. T2.26MG-19.2B]
MTLTDRSHTDLAAEPRAATPPATEPLADTQQKATDDLFEGVPATGVLPTHTRMLAWLREVVRLVEPAAVHFCDGSRQEADRLADHLVDVGTFIRLDERRRPNSYLARTDPRDVARVEDRTFICSVDEADAGPTNNWMAPNLMKEHLRPLFRGSMRGRTMYVMPFCMGPVTPGAKFGVEVSDSAYVVLSMRVMTRMGSAVQQVMDAHQVEFVECLHSVGSPLEPGSDDVAWPCNPDIWIAHFPEERSVWSFGSGYGGNSLLGKKCYALRIASVMGRDEGWLAEHMLVIRLTSPEGRSHHAIAAFPSACGKTNLAMLEPTLPGWTVQTLGDDIAWLRWDDQGRLRAINPEFGFFGVAPGTGMATNPIAMRTLEPGQSLFTNVALTDDGDVWWEGMTPDRPGHLIDWRGHDWTPDSPEKAAHPNSRFCTPLEQCPTLHPDWDDPAGVPVDLIIFGGRRATTVPLVSEARDWTHGVFLGATLSSETTAAASGAVGVLRRDPMAMLPFIGYHVADYFAHWLAQDAPGRQLPRIFQVNWFRRNQHGFLWPGFGDNSRVLAWMVGRLEGTATGIETPIGVVPTVDALDLTGLELAVEQVSEALRVDPDEWRAEVPRIRAWLASLGERVPAALHRQVDEVEARLG